MICTSYSSYTSRTVNFWNLVLSKKIIYLRGIFHGFSSYEHRMWHVPVRIQNGRPSSENADHPTAKPRLFHFEWWVGRMTWTGNFCECGLTACHSQVLRKPKLWCKSSHTLATIIPWNRVISIKNSWFF